jgi:hypothetical protein
MLNHIHGRPGWGVTATLVEDGLPEPDMPSGQASDEFQIRRTIPLAFLAPDIQRAIFEGRQPQHLTLLGMMDGGISLLWSEQRKIFGFEG